MNTARPRLEVADLVRAAGERLNQDGRLSLAQGRVLQHIAACRTAALGGHVDQCDACGHQRPSYNSCRDRHCPKCQASAQARWLDQRLARLLPVPYFHVVFTVPDELSQVLLRNQRRGYSILFAAAAGALQELAADPHRLGAQLAITAVLHTWGQSLRFHPHLHCVVSGGGLSLDGRCWVTGHEHYLLPVRVLAKMFRGKFLADLEDVYQQGQLDLDGTCAELASPSKWAAWRDQLYHAPWIVYAKPPFGGPEVVFRYLGRYTHRVAISNHRLVALAGDHVTFTVKDYADHGRRKTMTLTVEQFLRRFLLHVLPGGFVRIRHYGLVAGRNVTTKLALARRLLAKRKSRCQSAEPARPAPPLADPQVCPACGQSRLRRLVILPETSHRWASNLARASPPVLVVAT